MKKGIVCAVLIFAVAMSACSSGVSQSEYDKAVSEKESLRKKYDKAVSEKESLQKKYDSLQESYEKFKKEYTDLLNEKSEDLILNLPAQYAQAWVDTAFSDDGICFGSEDTLFVSILTDKTVNVKNIRDLRNEFISAIKPYSYMQKTVPEYFSWKYISATFYDASGAGIFQLTIDTESAMLKSVLLNHIYIDDLTQGLQ